VWNLVSGHAEATLEGHASGVSACAVTPDGRRVISASRDHTLKVWDLTSGRAEAILEGHASGVSACAVTPDGRRVVSASWDGTLKVWDLATGRPEATLRGHADRVSACVVTPDGQRVVSASHDGTLKVWDLATGRAERTLVGHTKEVSSCAVTRDGRQVVSASYDNTLIVWELQTGACLLTHRANTYLIAIATTTTTIIAGDAAGAIWFLDWPSPDARQGSAPDERRSDNRPASSGGPEIPAQRPPMKHTILFLAANPFGTDRLALDREARAIQVELERSGFRDRFEFVTRWAAEPLDLLRELRKLKPTVVHFSGHGTAGPPGHAPGAEPRRDVDIEPSHSRGDLRSGLFFQGPDGGAQLVSTEALEATFGAAGSSVQLVVLSACYSELNAQALLRHVGCVVGMRGTIADDAARSFAIGFYGGLGERESIAAAYEQGCAAIHLQGLGDHDRPKLAVRTGIDAAKLVLAADPAPIELTTAPGSAMESPPARSKADQTQPGRDPYVASTQVGQTEEMRMTTDELFDLLSKLLPAQFEAVLFRARVPVEYLPAAIAPQTERAIATIRYFESQSRLDQLARTVHQVVTGGGQIGPDPR
jgi:hypothetical protein